MLRFYQYIIMIFALLIGSQAFAAENPHRMAIFYPEAKEPYRSIYQEIIAGTKEAINNQQHEVELTEFLLTKKLQCPRHSAATH